MRRLLNRFGLISAVILVIASASLLQCDAHAQQASPQGRDEGSEMGECFKRIDAVADAVKGQPADFNIVYNFFVSHYGKPKKMENDSQYLTMSYDEMVQAPGEAKPQHTMIAYKFHYETSTTRALFGIVNSTSEPFLLGECSFSFAPTILKAK